MAGTRGSSTKGREGHARRVLEVCHASKCRVLFTIKMHATIELNHVESTVRRFLQEEQAQDLIETLSCWHSFALQPLLFLSVREVVFRGSGRRLTVTLPPPIHPPARRRMRQKRPRPATAPCTMWT